jgi:indolepyruvate ferredoxin oxidoreductase, beta subunit
MYSLCTDMSRACNFASERKIERQINLNNINPAIMDIKNMNVTRLIIVAVGGQGNLLASRVLGEAALLADIPVRMSEIHGMAQRGGVVESAIVFGNARSTIISDGEADILLGFEPSESLRAMNRCNPNTVVITNLSPLPPFTVAIGKGKYPDIDLVKSIIRQKTRKLIAIDAVELAKEAGNVLAVNMVLLGALIQTEVLPLTVDNVKKAIKTRIKATFVEINLKAFDLGFQSAQKV